ncbi:HPF/RaiA family ribosome-associated protein [Bacterioplanoides sp.]|uniref:HPF/RaiA family ribosome-associated protein n=1 Tax=Bacterioplanoides sp. TaxID=2066072 RepID=UPI003B008A55
MQIEIQSRNIPLTKELRSLLKKRVEFAFNRFHHRIQKIRVRLDDINGPKGGIDKDCQFYLTLPDQPDVVVRSQASEIEAAISKTASRSASALSRKFSKRHYKRDHQHSPVLEA